MRYSSGGNTLFRVVVALILLAVSFSALAERDVGERCNTENGEEESCYIEHGTGKQYCRKPPEESRTRWSKCYVESCDQGFEKDGNQCVSATATSTSTSTSTSSSSTSTTTGTQTSTMTVTLTATWTSTASHVDTVTKKHFEREVSDLGRGTELNQKDSLKRAQQAAELGANYGASVAVVYCMEGMNVTSDLPELSGSDFAACRDHFQSADQMKEMAQQAAFVPDKQVMDSEGAKSTREEFEKKFAIDPDEAMGRIFSSKGSRSEIADILKSKVDDKKLEKAFEIADSTPKAATAESFVLELGAKGARLQNTALREKLRAQTAASSAPKDREARNHTSPGSDTMAKHSKLGHIEPLSTEEFFPSEKQAEHEVTIFDVVKRKYREMSRRQNLVPQAKSP